MLQHASWLQLQLQLLLAADYFGGSTECVSSSLLLKRPIDVSCSMSHAVNKCFGNELLRTATI